MNDPELVTGVLCGRGHLNCPNVAYCVVCGVSMVNAPATRVRGRRPALGVLVLDDGTVVPLSRDHVLGRAPQTDGTVTTGAASAIRLDGPLVSRVHARLELDGWAVGVVDQRSTNGTFVWPPGARSWVRLAAGQRVVLPSGSVVAVGSRQVHFYSHRSH